MTALRTPFLKAIIFLGVILGTASLSLAQDGLVQMVVDLLGDEDPDMRALAFEQVRSQAPGEEATKVFAAQLVSLSSDDQLGLLAALAGRGDGAARGSILELLAASDEESVKVAAIATLGSLGDEDDLPQLFELLTAASQAEQAAARASLVQLSGASISTAIATKMRQSPPPLSVTLIEILTTRRAMDSIPDILTAAVDNNPEVRSAAMTALGQIAGPQHIGGMVQGVLQAEAGQERAAAEKAIMFACSRIEDSDERAAPLLSVMQTLGASQQAIMMSTLGRVGGSAALEVVESAIGNPDPGAHDIGIRALCNWPDASVESRLLELARTEPRPEHRTMTLRALVRIAPLPDDRTDGHRLDVLRTALVMCESERERKLVLNRARAIRIVEALRFVAPYMDQPQYAELACETVIELAHHRGLREPNKAEFEFALNRVILITENATLIDRAERYKRGDTWSRPQ